MPQPPSTVPILTYHSLDDSGSVISVAPAAFREHVRILVERGFHGIPLRDLLAAWNGAAELPARPVVLTFDDAFASLDEHGLPALCGAGFSATIFTVAGFMGKSNDWPTQPAGVPRMALMSQAHLRTAAETGFEIGSHTITHPRLNALSSEELRHEIADSKEMLEQSLACQVSSFAYPYGEMNAAARRLVGEHYAGAVSVEMGTARRSDDHSALPRLDVYYLRDPATFRRFGTPLGSAYLLARSLGRQCRGMLERCGVTLS